MTQPHSSVLLVGGSDEHQRRKLVSKVTSARRADGWNVLPIDGSTPNALGSVFAMSGMFSASTFCVVTKPEKLDPAVLADHIQDPDPKVTLMLVTESDKAEGPVLGLVPKKFVKVFTLPAFYKMEEYAAAFSVREAKERGNLLEDTLALALVRKVGTDLGVLSFEIQKVSLFAGPGIQITAAHLRESLAPLSETDGSAVLEALGLKDAKRLSMEMAKYKSSRGGDPTIELCGRTFTPSITRWLQASHLAEAGMSAAAAAGSVGANPWYWENKILPYAVRWRVAGCARLLGIVARSQTLVFQGAVSPYAYLEANFMALLRE